jgi:hypothetical protein
MPEAMHRVGLRTTARDMFEHGGELLVLVVFALGLGMAIYHWSVGLPWTDAFLNASMILGGMGPVDDLTRSTPLAKLLAGLYALFSGLVFLVVAGAMLAPLTHAVLHRFHMESAGRDHET